MNGTRRPYSTPTVKTLDARQLLEALGPAHCGYGPSPRHPMGRGTSGQGWIPKRG